MKPTIRFFGYNAESEMRAANPLLADHLVATATQHTIRACHPGRQCTGSSGGTFYYADGGSDSGRDITTYRAVFDGVVFQWNKP